MNATDESEILLPETCLCASCLAENRPLAYTCWQCGAPVSNLAMFDPYTRTLAEGFALRSAVDGPPRLIVLAGIWMIFAPGAVLSLIFVQSGWRADESITLWSERSGA